MSGVILAIETSQRQGEVALQDAAGEVHVEPLTVRKRHDDDLLPAIDRIVRRAGLTPDALRGGCLGVSIGPGGFTGLRIAVSVAKMFALTLEMKIAAIPSALVVVQASVEAGGDVGTALIALATKRQTCWMTGVKRDVANALWVVQGQPRLVSAEAFTPDDVDALIADAYVPGSMLDACAARGMRIIEPVFSARACLDLARHRHAQGRYVEAHALLPLYAREPEAVALWEARLARDAQGDGT
jgi:tRNA threonylcarbamoyladenosine biosynthesis protein TsaB